MTLNKYYLIINENDWNILSDFFGYIFKVTNKYNYIKCLFLQNILKKQVNKYKLIKLGYISIEKDSKILNLKKIYKCIKCDIEKLKKNKFLKQKKNYK